jgi:hypothetical protein
MRTERSSAIDSERSTDRKMAMRTELSSAIDSERSTDRKMSCVVIFLFRAFYVYNMLPSNAHKI